MRLARSSRSVPQYRRVTPHDFTEAWLRNRRLSAHTRAAYRRDIAGWLAWCAGSSWTRWGHVSRRQRLRPHTGVHSRTHVRVDVSPQRPSPANCRHCRAGTPSSSISARCDQPRRLARTGPASTGTTRPPSGSPPRRSTRCWPPPRRKPAPRPRATARRSPSSPTSGCASANSSPSTSPTSATSGATAASASSAKAAASAAEP